MLRGYYSIILYLKVFFKLIWYFWLQWQADCDMSDPKCLMDSWFQLQDRIKKDPKIKEEDKLTDSDMQLMSRDTMIAGMFILVYVYVAIGLPFMNSASSQACVYLAK